MHDMTGSEPAGERKTRVSTLIPFAFTPGEVPRVCPKCKSPYWNVPRRKK